MDMDMEEIVFHTLFFVWVISSIGIIFYYRRTVRILISTSLFFISFVCAFPAMYIGFIPFEILDKGDMYISEHFSIMFTYIYGLPLLFLILFIVVRFLKIRIHPIALLWLVNSGMYSFLYLLLLFITDA